MADDFSYEIVKSYGTLSKGKGVTLTKEELVALKNLLNSIDIQ